MVWFPIYSSKKAVSILKLARAGFKGSVASIGSEAGPDSVNLDRPVSLRGERTCLADTNATQGRTLDKNHIPQKEKMSFLPRLVVFYMDSKRA
jgi:hypothetical protein